MHRTLLIATSLAALVGCSAPSPANEAAVSNVAEPPAVAAPQVAAPTAPPAATTPGELKTFGDWAVGCDNLRNCQAVALAPEDGVGDWPAFLLSIERDAGAEGAIRVTLSGQSEATPPVRIAIDGKQVAEGGPGFAGADAAAIATAIAGGRSAVVRAGRETAINSLGGASAALRYIDAQQGRADTAGALVAKGAGPDRSVAAAAPVIRAIAPAGTAATLTPAVEAELRKIAECGIADFVDDVPRAETHALGGGTTLVLLPCDQGAYNAIAALFVIGADGKPVPAKLDADTGMSPEAQPVPTVVNPDFADGVLSTYAKGRGLGDCGTTQSFVWDGQRLRMTEMAAMSECRGSMDYITVWRAEVTR
ncbi:DUF1176 domain-containing protein [Sphingomonas qomolangmaensis]|uniref:DUF1176 domain-containing protein n=1 Tax=Sphingomonas qomolangmaensis TaxID=2918765 RepID=A0ABY5L753_9SPHN|nr:DUF1176 domain-containing protein [Sphingomonas qomolangmaensis]UUL81570.1 DUF1176 domain-containing protein [Sphingomonas qomolangmaensis]